MQRTANPTADSPAKNGRTTEPRQADGQHDDDFAEGLESHVERRFDSVSGSIADAVDLWPNGGWPDGTAAHAPHPAFSGRAAGPQRPAAAGAGASVFTARPRPAAAPKGEPHDRDRDTWDIREAFLSLAAERLTDTARNDAARANAFLSQFGFEPDDVETLGFGLYPDPAEVEDHLKRCGFAEAAVRDSKITRDGRGDLRSNWAGHLVLPIDDETGRCVDLAVIDPAPGPHRVMQVGLVRGAEASSVVAYGLRNALKEQSGDRKGTLVLTEDLLEACLLNARGFGPVAAIGGEGSTFAPRRWEELARLGIGTVTLAFREDAGRHDAVRDCLVHALRARTAPEVFVLEPTGPADCETLAETVRVRGVAAAEDRLNHRTLAFHGKDFGAAPRGRGDADWAVRQPPRPERPAPKPQPRFVRPEPKFVRPEPRREPQPSPLEAFREKVRAALIRLPHGPERRAAAVLFAEVDAALADGRTKAAKTLLSRGFRFDTSSSPRSSPGDDGRERFASYGSAWGERNGESRESIADENGRSWFTDPGRTDGYARGWSTEDRVEPHRSATTHTLAGVLDGLCDGGRGPAVCDRLHGETAAAVRPGTLTALTAADPAASLAMVCDRLADALDRTEHGPVTVLLRDAAPGTFTALLIAHLTARLNGGRGLTAGEVDARLAGRDAAHRYGVKPWLADEAADRLRQTGDRLRIVDARGADFAATLHGLTRSGSLHASSAQADGSPSPSGGLLCDAADAGDLSRLAEFAAETGCWILAATAPTAPVSHAAPVWRAEDARRAWMKEDSRPETRTESGRLRSFRDLVGEWIDRAAA